MSAVPVSRAHAERVSWSVAAVFFVVGLALSAWFTQIPQFKAALSLNDAQLGAALLCPVAGALASMQVAGRIARRYSSAALVRAAPLGPAAIGWLAEGIGLTWSLSSVLLVLGAVGWFATWTSRALPASQVDQQPMTARGPGGRD